MNLSSGMADVLRLLAVHVAEPAHGRFEWVITERVREDQWKEIARGDDTYGVYKDAMANGLVALEQMIPDLEVGPRRDVGKSEPAQTPRKRSAQPAASDARNGAARPEATPKNAPYFGFGPIR